MLTRFMGAPSHIRARRAGRAVAPAYNRALLERQGPGGPSGLQNRQAVVAQRSVGSTPAPLRSAGRGTMPVPMRRRSRRDGAADRHHVPSPDWFRNWRSAPKEVTLANVADEAEVA